MNLKKIQIAGVFFLASWAFSFTASAEVTDYIFSFGSSTSFSPREFGIQSTSTEQMGFSYRPQNMQYVCSVEIPIYAVNSPADSVAIYLYKGNPETGEFITNTTAISGTSPLIAQSAQWKRTTFEFTNCQNLDPQFTYTFMARRTGSLCTYPCSSGSKYQMWERVADIYNYTARVIKSDIWYYGTDKETYFNLIGLPNFSIDSSFTATASDSWYNLSGADEFCNEHFPSSGSWNPLNTFNICVLAGYLIIPNPYTIQGTFLGIKDELYTRIPFSYVFQFADTILDSTNQPHNSDLGLQIPLELNLMGVSTSLNFAPLASASLTMYAGSWYSSFRNFLDYFLYVAWAIMWYRIITNKFHQKS